jgi:hypothetical protein
MPTEKIKRLNVPYSQKDLAKSLGARWNSRMKAWYAPKGANLSLFEQWLPKPSDAQKPAATFFEKRSINLRKTTKTTAHNSLHLMFFLESSIRYCRDIACRLA